MNMNRKDKTITVEKISVIISELKYINGDRPTVITVKNA
jgi:hypothetical protein